MRRILLVFLKFPEPGRVKTRIAAETGEERAAEIYRELTGEVFVTVRTAASTAVRVVFDPPGREAEVRDWLQGAAPLDCQWEAQADGGLGERLKAAFASAFSSGFAQVAVIGTDAPGLTPAHLEEAWAGLDAGSDAVFGPALDGGFYLLALRKNCPGLFEGIPWSEADTLEQCIAKADLLGLTTSTLVPLSDIDTLADWEDWQKQHPRPAGRGTTER